MTLPDALWRHRPGMDRLLAALDAKAGATRFVGGCVRDTLLGLAVSDVDLATRLAPEEVVRRLEAARIKAVPTGLAHGTITAVSEGAPVEITTLRRDVSTDGRRATVAYTEDWREDAMRRDFTINALSADPASGEVFDYFDGLTDLEARRVRFIGDPLQRIAEDHLRILRFFRFHARFGAGAPDEAALDACEARANDLMALSRERIADELLKLLALPDPAPTVALMIERAILKPVLPEIRSVEPLAKLVERERAAGIEPYALRRLAALLPADPGIADDIASRLRLSNDSRRRLILAADRANWQSGSPFQRLHGIGAEALIDRLLLGDDGIDLVSEHVAAIRERDPPRFGLKGSDLIAMGLPQGPLVAKTLNEISRIWVAEDFPPEERLQAIARAQIDQALRSSQ
jgi:poly(A) polymerase